MTQDAQSGQWRTIDGITNPVKWLAVSAREPNDCSLQVDIIEKETQFTVVFPGGWRTCVIRSQDAKDLALIILQALGEAPPKLPTRPFDPCVRLCTTYSVEWKVGSLLKSQRVDSSEDALTLAIQMHQDGAKNITMTQQDEATYRGTTTFDFEPPSGSYWKAR